MLHANWSNKVNPSRWQWPLIRTQPKKCAHSPNQNHALHNLFPHLQPTSRPPLPRANPLHKINAPNAIHVSAMTETIAVEEIAGTAMIEMIGGTVMDDVDATIAGTAMIAMSDMTVETAPNEWTATPKNGVNAANDRSSLLPLLKNSAPSTGSSRFPVKASASSATHAATSCSTRRMSTFRRISCGSTASRTDTNSKALRAAAAEDNKYTNSNPSMACHPNRSERFQPSTN